MVKPRISILALAYYTSVSPFFFRYNLHWRFSSQPAAALEEVHFPMFIKSRLLFKKFGLIKICNILPRAVFNLPFLAVARPGEPNN